MHGGHGGGAGGGITGAPAPSSVTVDSRYYGQWPHAWDTC